MSWSIINVRLRNCQATAPIQDLINQILRDGWEPFSTAGVGNDLVVSFRLQNGLEGKARIPESDEVELFGLYL